VPHILDDPIDWTRDNNRAEVPENVSMNAGVKDRWHAINITVFDGTPVEHDIKAVEEFLLLRKALIDGGTLSAEFDWKHDFELARYSHRFHLTNLDYLRNKRTSYINFWTGWITEATNYNREVSLNGLKTIFLLHGAIAIGALNILAQHTTPGTQLVLTAKFAIIFGASGIVLAGLGQIIVYYFGTLMVTRVRAKLVGDVKWAKARAVSRYLDRYGWLPLLGNKAIYGSMLWFACYVVILLIMLLSV